MYDPKAYERWLRNCEVVIRQAREILPHAGINEVALLFENPGELESFCTWATQVVGMDNFFSVPMDVMARTDAPGTFDVRFEFLRHEASNWRVEAMCPLNGEYPLHHKHLRFLGNGCIIHVSYKLPTLEEYFAAMGDLEANKYVRMAAYQNTYGVFSYWESMETLYYWKPRVNLRDQLPQL